MRRLWKRGANSAHASGRVVIVLVIALGALPGLAFAPGAAGAARANCVDYRDYAHRVGWAALPGAVRDVALHDSLVIAADTQGLQVLDLRNADEPRLVASLTLPGARSLALAGDLAFAIDSASSLHVVDLADPGAPALLASLALPGPGSDLEIAGGLACVAADTAGIYVIDVSTPDTPVFVAQFNTPYHANDVALQGGYAFVADRHSLVVFDLASGRCAEAVPAGRPDANMHAVAVAGDFAYLLDSNFGIIIFDVSEPLAPIYMGSAYEPGEGRIAAIGGRLYAGTYTGLGVYDLIKPATPFLICEVNTTDIPADLAVSGDQVYVAIPARAQIDILNLTHPVVPARLDQISLTFALDVDLAADGFAYVSCSFNGMAIVDARDPEALDHQGFVSGLARAQQTVIVGDYAYVAAGSFGLQIVDISEPDGAHVVGSVGTPESARAVAVAGDWAYVGDLDGLSIIDVSVPAAPSVVGRLLTPPYPVAGVAIALPEARLLLADGMQLRVVDIEEPSAPNLLESIALPARSLRVEGGLAYALGEPGLWTFRVEPDGTLTPLGSLPLPGYPYGIALAADGSALAASVGYFANNSGGLQVVDLGDPSQPRTLGSIPRWPAGVAAGAEAIFVADSWGLTSYPLHCDPTGVSAELPAATLLALSPNYPNPFNPSTLLSYRLAAPGRLRLSIHDAQGRLQRRLVDDWQEAGAHSAAWDGRDERGRPLPNGVYLARFAVAGKVQGQQLILLK